MQAAAAAQLPRGHPQTVRPQGPARADEHLTARQFHGVQPGGRCDLFRAGKQPHEAGLCRAAGAGLHLLQRQPAGALQLNAGSPQAGVGELQPSEATAHHRA